MAGDTLAHIIVTGCGCGDKGYSTPTAGRKALSKRALAAARASEHQHQLWGDIGGGSGKNFKLFLSITHEWKLPSICVLKNTKAPSSLYTLHPQSQERKKTSSKSVTTSVISAMAP